MRCAYTLLGGRDSYTGSMRRVLGFVLVSGALLAACGQSGAPVVAPSEEPARPPVTSSPPASPTPSVAAAASVPPSTVVSGAPAASSSGAAPASLAPSAPGAPTSAIAVAPASPAASATPPPLPANKRIGPLVFISQTLNNCGPASIAEVLSFFGVQRTQAQVAAVLRPDLPAYGMSLYGVPFYAESVGMKATGEVAGSDQLIKAFVASGIPVIVSDQVSKTDATRHFRPIDGYDDQAGYFIGSDPYLGPNHQISYAEFDDIWRISANRWVAVYPPSMQDVVDMVMTRYGNHAQAVQAGLARAEQRAAQQPKLPWSWLELADMQIDAGNLQEAGPYIQKCSQLGLPLEAHWLQLKLQRAGGLAA
jgi:predicted double-glycine peptidase